MKTKLLGLAASLLLAFAPSAFGASITNPSFEADTFNNFPGYISGNSAITGWTAGNNSRAGINPGGGNPFADNGTVPAGSQVAFIQNAVDASLSTVLSGLTVGETYKVNFRVNARSGNTPNLKVDIDANNIINTAVTPVNAVNPYKYFAFDFTASAASHTMTLRNDAGGDNTLLIDDFSIDVRNSGWSYAAWNDDATSGVDGSRTYTHAYSFGSPVSTTINGILFTGVGGANPSSPTFTTTGLGALWNFNDPNNVTGGSEQLANDFVYNGFPATITMNGLIPGAEYVATIYSVAWETGTRAATFSVGNDRLTVNQDHFGDNNGIRFIYRFIAAGSSATLTFTPTEGNSIHTYGFSNYELNAPPTAPLIVANPQSRCVSEGQPFTLSGSASGAPAPSYRWQKEGVDVTGAMSSSLNFDLTTPADAGGYTLIASNASGTATSAVAIVKVGLPLVNPSFEVDTYTACPGYSSQAGNGAITGWAALGGHGLNPAVCSPFADNGAIPDRNQVAFMQQDGALSQVVSGFTNGDVYYVVYFENARSGGVPAIEVKIGDTTIVPAHSRFPVGGANPYVEVISDVFTATGTDMQLSFIKSNPNGGDTTALIDNVCVIRVPAGTAPFITTQPAAQIVSVNDAATFDVSAVGSLPLAYFWQKDGVAIAGANSASFTIPTVAKTDEGNYSVIVSNSAGSATSMVARLTVFEPIATLFNTGLDSNHVALADNSVDPNYALIVNPDVPSTNAIVEDSTAFPIVGGPWLANTASSKWIGPRLDTSASAVGLYTYRTTFDLTNRDPSTVVIIGRWASDNSGRDIRVNGVSTGNPQSPTFAGYTAFNISTSNASFNPGLNTIDFIVENETAPGYTGLRVEFTSSNARILPNIRPEITMQPVSQTVAEGDDVTLVVTATGSDPLTYQWLRNGVTLTDKTNRTLLLTQIAECASGEYQVTVQNGAGMTSSVPVIVSVAFRPVPGIYGTGVNDDYTLRTNGAVDLHYFLGSSPDVNFPGPDAIVVTDGQFPIGPWAASGPRSKWIAPRADQGIGNAEGNYTYQTFFDLTGVDLSRFRIAGGWAVDNTGTDVLVNGVSTGITSAGFGGLTPFVITSGFANGVNSLDFLLNNAPVSDNPTGLRVDLRGLIDIRPTLSITRVDATHVSVAWSSTNSCHRLQFASEVNGPWTTVVGATNPQELDTTLSPARYFRITP